MNTLDVRTPSRWRKWLATHHDSESEVWLVFHKRHTGKGAIAYGDAVDEALCFGWIDSLIKRLDEDRYARKFTPRKPNSKWSPANRKRYEKLAASARLRPPGLKRAPTVRSYEAPPGAPEKLPGYIRDALRKRPRARRFFESLAPSYRRNYVLWIDSAKKRETKMRRLEEAVRLLASGRKLGLK